jgi:O-acetylhomoserine/O-acetylserine sulfhydrylase-like pyridoxal-dependent enzyme
VSKQCFCLPIWLISLTIIVSFIRVTGAYFPYRGYLALIFRNIGTKYFGGHSDLLAGILVVKTLETWDQVSTLCPENV